MPLSEQEQRLLEEMERSLYQNDADFVATVNPRRGKTNYTILAVGVLVAVVGIATLVGGVIIQQPLVGVLGFAVMFVGVLLAVAPLAAPGSQRSLPPRPSAHDRLLDSWTTSTTAGTTARKVATSSRQQQVKASPRAGLFLCSKRPSL